MKAARGPRTNSHVAPMNKSMSRIHFRYASAFALIGLFATAAPGCKKPAPPAVQEDATAAVSVTTAEVVAIEAPQALRLTGTLRGKKETDLAANVAGRVLTVNVERGTEVKLGAMLAQVDVSAAALSLAEAKVQVQTSKTQQDISEADCARYEQLKSKGAVTDLEYDQMTAKCKTAPLNLEAARARQSLLAKNVGDGQIRSPFAGVVTERYVEVGEYVQPSSRVVSLAQVDELRLEFSVPEANWPDVKQDAEVSFRVAAHGDTVFHGKVVHISGAVRPTRDVLVEAQVPNPDKKLLPGMFADVEVAIGTKSMPSVPKEAVFEQNGKHNVLVVKDGILEQRVLQAAPEFQNRIPVFKGVALGEKVVERYSPTLSNGQRVN